MVSCGEDNLTSDNIHAVEIYLTDDPLDAEEVNIEILSVILVGEDTTQVIELNTLSGIYNLLDFQGDIDTLIASGNYDLDHIKQIRLVLGTNNTIKIDGEVFPLEIPGGAHSGLKINIDEELIGKSLVSLLIDFDACKSVKEMHGEYKLKPVIHYKGDRNKKDLDLDEVVELDSCYTIEFPVSVKNSDGTISMVGSAEELEALIENEEITGIVYPFNVIDEEGKTHKVNNANQAKKLVKECEDEDDHGGGKDYDFGIVLDSLKVCFELQYPLSVVLEDGTTVEVMNDEELNGLENSNQLLALLKNCADDDDDDDHGHHGDDDFEDVIDDILDCFEIVFPLTVLDADSMELTIDSLEQLIAEIKEGNIVAFISEITIVDADGNTVTIDSFDDLAGVLGGCRHEDHHNEIFEKLKDCIEFEFPLTIEKNGEKIEVLNIEELIALFDSGEDCKFVYPFRVKQEKGNMKKSKKINNGNQLRKLLDDCK